MMISIKATHIYRLTTHVRFSFWLAKVKPGPPPCFTQRVKKQIQQQQEAAAHLEADQGAQGARREFMFPPSAHPKYSLALQQPRAGGAEPMPASAYLASQRSKGNVAYLVTRKQ